MGDKNSKFGDRLKIKRLHSYFSLHHEKKMYNAPAKD